jgi:hypothetical protein
VKAKVKEVFSMDQPNELILEPGAKIALSIVRNSDDGISVIVAEEIFQDVDDNAVEKIINCVRDTINAARNQAATPLPGYVN